MPRKVDCRKCAELIRKLMRERTEDQFVCPDCRATLYLVDVGEDAS